MVATETSTLMNSEHTQKQEEKNAPKPKSKSRSGCLTCKSRRLKCDEMKPFCLNCLKKKIKCGGYATRFKWRSFNDAQDASSDSGPQKRKRSRDNSSYPTKPSTMSASSSVRSDMSPWSDMGHSQRRSVGSQTPQDAETPTETLSLKEHLELTSLSVLGKSTKEIKLENDLLAKGINPDTYYDDEPYTGKVKKMRRSYSSNEIINHPVPQSLQRSYSTSSPQASEVANFRSEFRSMAGLHSLAEAAVDEISARTPEGNLHVGLDQSPEFEFAKPHSPRIAEITQTPKSWQLQHVPQSPADIAPPNVTEAISDLNLTPSLSALFNFVFTNPDHARGDAIPLGNMGLNLPDSALSPLDLSSAHMSQFPSHSPDVRRSSIAKSETENVKGSDKSRSSSSLLNDVGSQLIRLESRSPSISSSGSSESLLKTSEHQQILYLYSTYTCGIMSIKSGVSENPWRNIYLPLAGEYSYLFNSIASMTLFHLAGNARLRENSLALRSKGYFYMKKCILELATGLSRLENGEMSDDHLPADVALATCLNLAVSESWDTHTSSGIAHLKGAKSMIQKVLSIITQYSSNHSKHRSISRDDNYKKKLVLVTDEEWRKMEEPPSVCTGDASSVVNDLFIPKNIQLLFNEWIYFEVLSQMTSYSGHDDKGIDLVATITHTIQTNQKKKMDIKELKSEGSSPESVRSSGSSDQMRQGFSFFENLDTMLQNKECVDPLLGCAQSLFSIMGKVANLISKVRKSQENDKKARNTLANITSASELKRQLTDWKPSVSTSAAGMMNQESEDASWDLYSCVSTAEAYRYATLLYLHEAVPEVPSISSHQLAEKVFVLLASIPSTSNLYIVHIFPLLVSSCEASPGEEREWCEARWALLVERIWIGNIDRAFEVVKEVWRRKDEYNRNVSRDVNEKKADSGLDFDDARNISAHLQEVVAAMRRKPSADEKGITSKLHWSSVMREWGWEVLLA
ncbi:hypothetical protein OXX80_002337 [Metschnikowia pulcherrima]